MKKIIKQNIWIECQWTSQEIVGYYEIDESGKLLLGPGGQIYPDRTHCYDAETCPHTECVLNAQGKGLKFPKSFRREDNGKYGWAIAQRRP